MKTSFLLLAAVASTVAALFPQGFQGPISFLGQWTLYFLLTSYVGMKAVEQ